MIIITLSVIIISASCLWISFPFFSPSLLLCLSCDLLSPTLPPPLSLTPSPPLSLSLPPSLSLSLSHPPTLPPSLSLTGFRIRWLLESYLGLKHVPFEHFACCSACARTLNDSFQSIQSRLKQQHDREYQTMLEKYADMEPAGRPRHWSLFRKARKELEVRELWCTDFGQPTAGRRRAWTAATVGTGGRAASTWRSRHPHHHHHHRRHHHRSSRSGCTLM